MIDLSCDKHQKDSPVGAGAAQKALRRHSFGQHKLTEMQLIRGLQAGVANSSDGRTCKQANGLDSARVLRRVRDERPQSRVLAEFI